VGKKNVIVMYTCKDNLIPLLYSGKIKKKKKKIWDICAIEYYSAIKKNKIMPFVAKKKFFKKYSRKVLK